MALKSAGYYADRAQALLENTTDLTASELVTDRVCVADRWIRLAELAHQVSRDADEKKSRAIAAAGSVEDLEAAGVVKRGSSLARAAAALREPAPASDEGSGEEHRWPCADDGSEFPAVRKETSGRLMGNCPSCGWKRAEYQGDVLRCMGKVNGAACRTGWPRWAVPKLIELNSG